MRIIPFNIDVAGLICKTQLIFCMVLYFIFIVYSNHYRPNCPASNFLSSEKVEPAISTSSNAVVSSAISDPTPQNPTPPPPPPPSSTILDPVPTDSIATSSSITESDSAMISDPVPKDCPTVCNPVVKKAPVSADDSPTNLSHLVFGLVGSEQAWHHRKAYIESWWKPNGTKGFLFLDKEPSEEILPWSSASPPYRISDDITKYISKPDITAQRIFHGILETYREADQENMRWLVMGDDDSIFFLENMVNVLAKYDHTKYYYIGGHSEFIFSNYWFSFSQGFGGAGFMLSAPLAKIIAEQTENCLRRYQHLEAADLTTMSCVADLGVSLTALPGIHQMDMRGDVSGFFSSHPQFPLVSVHHFDMVEPIFPTMDRFQSTSHMMRAAKLDESRMLQQIICHHRKTDWTFSIAWGYSVQVYEKIMPRSYLQYPIETFETWLPNPTPPNYMFNTRMPSNDSCEAPHVFFYKTITRTAKGEIYTRFTRARPRGLPACPISGTSADIITKINVISPATKRTEHDKCECCDVRVHGHNADVRIRECIANELLG